MADHTDRKLTRHTLRRTELGSVDADFLYRARGASSFLRALLNSQGEESFTPVLHGALHRPLYRSAAGKARKLNPIDVPKTVGLDEVWHDVRAGATPPFDAPCVKGWGRSRPHIVPDLVQSDRLWNVYRIKFSSFAGSAPVKWPMKCPV